MEFETNFVNIAAVFILYYPLDPSETLVKYIICFTYNIFNSSCSSTHKSTLTKFIFPYRNINGDFSYTEAWLGPSESPLELRVS
jgi:hypothetical protein